MCAHNGFTLKSMQKSRIVFIHALKTVQKLRVTTEISCAQLKPYWWRSGSGIMALAFSANISIQLFRSLSAIGLCVIICRLLSLLSVCNLTKTNIVTCSKYKLAVHNTHAEISPHNKSTASKYTHASSSFRTQVLLYELILPYTQKCIM